MWHAVREVGLRAEGQRQGSLGCGAVLAADRVRDHSGVGEGCRVCEEGEHTHAMGSRTRTQTHAPPAPLSAHS
jgi:hypothetical protein